MTAKATARRLWATLGTAAVVVALVVSVMSLPASAGSPPVITNFNPTSGPTGTTVTFNGSGFTGTTSVLFNGTGSAFSVNTTGTQLFATVPNGATTGPITLANPNGNTTTSSNFTVTIGAPTISGLNPASGAVGSTVTVNGSRFQGTSAVRFNGTAASFSVNAAGTKITTVVPTGATTGKVSVVTPGGTAQSANNFTVLGPGAPLISGFTPTFGGVGTSVTISGTRFTGVTGVKFHGVAAPFTFQSDSQVVATVPAGATDGKIALTTPQGTATSATSFNVVNVTVPKITGFSPHTGVVGTPVSIFGSGFFGTTVVRFNGTPVSSFAVVTDGKITTTVPAGATTGPITVTNPMGTASTAGSFTLAGPKVTSFSPTSGNIGKTVTIFGSGFTGVNAVRFNGKNAASFAFVNDGQVTAVVPNGAKSGHIAVVTASGTGVSSGTFTVIAPHKRSVSLSFQGQHPKATGSVTALDGFVACERNVPVVIKRFHNGSWRWLATTKTHNDGTYKVAVSNRPGRYQAQAKKIQLSGGATCGGDTSNTVTRH